MLEKDVEKKLVAGIKALGGLSYKFVSPGNAGVPDRLCILPGGKTIFVELKTTTGRPTELQQVQIARLNRLGAEVRVLHGLSEVTDFISDVTDRINKRELGGLVANTWPAWIKRHDI